MLWVSKIKPRDPYVSGLLHTLFISQFAGTIIEGLISVSPHQLGSYSLPCKPEALQCGLMKLQLMMEDGVLHPMQAERRGVRVPEKPWYLCLSVGVLMPSYLLDVPNWTNLTFLFNWMSRPHGIFEPWGSSWMQGGWTEYHFYVHNAHNRLTHT